MPELPTAQDVRAPSTSLNGFWERARRILKLTGQAWDDRLTPVVIVADAREAGELPQSYRRFTMVHSSAGHVVGTCFKIRCDLSEGMVINGIQWSSGNAAGSPVAHIRTMTPAQVIADAAAYVPATNAIGTLACTWSDGFAEGNPPISTSTGGAVNVGNPVFPIPYSSAGSGFVPLSLVLAYGAAINLYYQAATTNETIFLTAYSR